LFHKAYSHKTPEGSLPQPVLMGHRIGDQNSHLLWRMLPNGTGNHHHQAKQNLLRRTYLQNA